MKISRALENIQTEYQVYKQVAEELDGKKKDLFVQIFDVLLYLGRFLHLLFLNNLLYIYFFHFHNAL